MTVQCDECDALIFDEVMQVIVAEKKLGLITEYSGGDICSRHRATLERVVHSFKDMPDGEIIIINEATANFEENGRLPWGEKTNRTNALGYLSAQEAQTYLPAAYERLCSQISQEQSF